MSKKKKTKRSSKSRPPILLFGNGKNEVGYDVELDEEYGDEVDDEFDDMLQYLERQVEVNQMMSFSRILDSINSNRMQLGSIQLALVVISVLLSLEFFGWITALVIGLVLGFVALITFLAAIVVNLDTAYLNSRSKVIDDQDEDEEE